MTFFHQLQLLALLISAPSVGVYYFLSLTLSVCMSVCCSVRRGKLQIDYSFLILGGIEPFLAVSSPCGTLQKVVFRFLI